MGSYHWSFSNQNPNAWSRWRMLSHIRPMPTKRPYPSAPASPTGALPQTVLIPAGTLLTRFRGIAVPPATAYPPSSFNPNVGKDWTVATDGARFNPFPDKDGDNVPTIYAATTYEAAALESVFHQVPHIQTPEIMRSQVETWEYFELRTLRDLRVVRLTNPSCVNSRCQGAPNRFEKMS